MSSEITVGVFTVKRFAFHKGKYYTYGGFGEFIMDFRKYFKSVILLAHVEEKAPPEGFYLVDIPNVEVVWLPVIKGELQVLMNLRQYFKIAKKHLHKMDLIQARMPDYTGVVGAILAKRHNIPFFNLIIADWQLQARKTSVFKKYGLGLLLKTHLLIYDYLERRLCRDALVLAQGNSCYEKHRRATRDCHLVLSSSHDKEDIVEYASPKFQNKPFRILNVARLDSIKNQQVIIKALSVLLEESPGGWKLNLVGEGNKREELIALAQQLKVDEHVEFKGQVPRGEELWSQFDTSDVFVLSSISEGTPKVLLEAFARGLPIVATDIPGVRTTVSHEETGFLFKSNDVSDLTEQLRKVAGSEELRNSIMTVGLEIARANTLEYRNKEMVSLAAKRYPELGIPDPLAVTHEQ